MRYEFQASRISGNGNAVFPDKLIIDDDKVTYYKGKLIGYDESVILRERIGSVSISTSGNAGAIASNAKGESRIYNCGILAGSVSGTGKTGGLVGLLDHKGEAGKGSRVINCFSYADIEGGSDVGGIV